MHLNASLHTGSKDEKVRGIEFDSNNVNLGSISGDYKLSSHYKPISQPRTHIGSVGNKIIGLNSGVSVLRSSSSSGKTVQAPGSLKSDLSCMKKNRVQDKRDLQELNERFAGYIEKMRFLEAQNKQLVAEIELLRKDKGKDNNNIKDIYEVEITQLRNLLNESEKEKAPLHVKINSLESNENELTKRINILEEIANNQKATIDAQRKELIKMESELVELRRINQQSTKQEVNKIDETALIKDHNRKLKFDYDQEVLKGITLEHELQTLKDTLEFERTIHQEELKELNNEVIKDTTYDNQSFWQNEMSRAIREIRNEYDTKFDRIKQDMESSYGNQIQEIRSNKKKEDVQTTYLKEENTKVKGQINALKYKIGDLQAKLVESERIIKDLYGENEEMKRAFEQERLYLQEELAETEEELRSTLEQLETILDAKLGLELEIGAYRKLMDLEETRGVDNSHLMMSEDSSRGQISTGHFDNSKVSSLNNDSNQFSSIHINSGGGGSTFVGGGKIIPSHNILQKQSSEDSKGSGKGSKRDKDHNLQRSDSATQKVRFRKTTKGNVKFSDCDVRGEYVVLENIGKDIEDISGFTIKRTIDNIKTVSYVIPSTIQLHPNAKLVIWANGKSTSGDNVHDLEIIEKSWGIGDFVVTILYNVECEEKATFHQELTS